MSRAGLSLAATAASSAPPESIPEEKPGLRIANLSDEESGSEADAEEEPEESLSDTDTDPESLTSNQMAERDAKHREKDEKRLKQDLTKHQQLLVDSQKINQSIRRCLDWTEELIKDGKKALAYQVKISDVQIGGKVLSPLDQEDGRSNMNDELEDDTIKFEDLASEGSGRASPWGLEPQDRDSGIVIPVDGG